MLAIFVKTPGHSPIKTRLAKATGAGFAEAWYRKSAEAVASIVRQLENIPAYWAVAEPDAGAEWPDLPHLTQPEGGLGERMRDIHETLLERHAVSILIGADTPQVTRELLQDAIDRLGDPDQPACIIGPAADGGFWLVGANHRLPREAWSAPAYSRPDTRERFVEAMRKAQPSLPWQELDTLTDVDTTDDLDAFISEMQALKTPTPEQRALLELTRDHTHA